MKLINTDGMAFIGPGSEWFWTAVSGIVLAVTFIAIYRQLRVQRDAAAIEQLNEIMREWSSERLARAKFIVLTALEAGIATNDLPNRSVAEVGFTWQKVGYLVRSGHVDLQLVYRNLGDQVQVWWLLLNPGRLADGVSDALDGWPDFTWLAGAAAALHAKHGIERIDAESLEAERPGMIAHYREAIEAEEALRTVTVRVTPTPIPVTTVRPQHADAVVRREVNPAQGSAPT